METENFTPIPASLSDQSEYDVRAEKFLTDTNTTLTWKFLECSHKYFDDAGKDYEKRLIWEFTLTRGERTYTSTFADSIHTTYMQLIGASPTSRYTLFEVECLNNAAASIRHAYGETKYTQFRKDRTQIRKKLTPPSAYSLLACLEKYPVEDLDQFASDYGYDQLGTKISKIVKMHKACTDQYNAMLMLYNDAEMEQLREIS